MSAIIKPVRLGVLLSGGGRTLENLLEDIRSDQLDAEVVVVIASRQCKGLEKADLAGLDTLLVPYKNYACSGEAGLVEYSARITAALDSAKVDLVILAGFLSKWTVPPKFIGRVMNIHPALLPRYGGRGMYGHHVHEAVLAAGETESGCSVHFVNNEYDAGPVILQRKVPVLPDDTPETLANRVFRQECLAYPQAIRLFAQGRLRLEKNKVIST